MAYAERRGDYYRARWRGPDGTLESSPANLRFSSKTKAVEYGRDQDASIRNNTYVDPRAGQITLVEWVNLWYPALDLELSTLDNYRYFIEVHILPTFGHRELGSLTNEEVSSWERELPLSRRTAKEARSVLINVLNDAVPRYIQFNPAARRRGKGRKGQRRIEEAEKAAKVWATPCPGGGEQPAEDPAIACWLSILPDLTPHGLRHGHQTMLDEADIRYGLTAERMGHEVPGMRGTYGHVSPAMRAAPNEVLQICWEESHRRRAEMSPRSPVQTLDGLLSALAA